MILSFGGIPLLWYGDELGTLNDRTFLADQNKAGDSRWIHRPRIDWERAELRKQPGAVEQRIFDGLKRLIAVRKDTPVFADYNNRELFDVDNPHLFVFLRAHPSFPASSVLVVANFDEAPQALELTGLMRRGLFRVGEIADLAFGGVPEVSDDQLWVPPERFFWLASQRPMGLW